MPEIAATFGLPGALSVMVKDALRVPEAVGVNETFIVQTAPGARVEAQVLVWPKSLVFAPVSAILEISREAVPVFARVIVLLGLVVPTSRIGNVRLAGDNVTLGLPPFTVWLSGDAEFGLKLASPEYTPLIL